MASFKKGCDRMFKRLVLSCFLLILVIDINKANFSWTASTSNDVANYNIMCGSSTGVYNGPKATVPGNTTLVTVRSVITTPGVYFCVVTASNPSGTSGFSNEISFQGTASAPSIPSGFTVK